MLTRSDLDDLKRTFPGADESPHRDDVPLPDGPEDFGLSADTGGSDADDEPVSRAGERDDAAEAAAAAKGAGKPPPKIEIATLPPLTLDEWRSRDLPEPDFLMGHWLTTTSRMLLTAATGLGKTNFGLALGMRISAGMDFLHWRAHRPARVLYIDGEMSRRLLRLRVLDEEQRVGITPEAFFALSHEDIEGFKPLNTIEGQVWMNALIVKVGGVDLVIADNIMCLTVGDMKDPEPWQQTIPWALSLTKRSIGQLWIHHTGHDETRSYGDKTGEWQMDTVAHLDAVKRDDTDISFSMSFKKAERTPATRFDFQDVKIALVNDQWEHELTDTRRPGKVSPQTQKALDALTNVLAGDQVVMLPGGRRTAHRDHWAIECNARGLIDVKRNESTGRRSHSRACQ
jgi:AAA domain